MKKMLNILLLVVLSSVSLSAKHIYINKHERITNFNVSVMLAADGSMIVQEDITVQCLGVNIKHGIFRTIPTVHETWWGGRHITGFSLLEVKRNGLLTPYSIKSVEKGKLITIRDGNKRLPLGSHTFSLRYKTNHHVHFFDTHDELYFNVTGNAWRLAIDSAQATVTVPEGATFTKVKAYTGSKGTQGQAYRYETKNNTVTLTTTSKLFYEEGFTIAIAWPKGIIASPNIIVTVIKVIKDNFMSLLLFIILVLSLMLLAYSLHIKKNGPKPGTIIPQFSPPHGLIPSAVGYLYYQQADDSFISSDILRLAVQGFITIDYKRIKGSWSFGKYYILNRTNKQTELATSHHEVWLLDYLFSVSKIFILQKKNQKILRSCVTATKKNATQHGWLIKTTSLINFFYTGCGGIAAMWWIAHTSTNRFAPSIISWVLIVLIGSVALITYRTSVMLTRKGQRLLDHINGFRMYLITAEQDRMNSIGTPPERTPELFEKYLPYAMILGVEKQWRKKFAPIFEKMAQENQTYYPYYFHSGLRSIGEDFHSNFAASFNVSFSSSSGTSGGSSGGGSGGGGGGGC